MYSYYSTTLCAVSGLSSRQKLFVYQKNAYPADELMPLSCQGRYRESQPNRGDIDDALGK